VLTRSVWAAQQGDERWITAGDDRIDDEPVKIDRLRPVEKRFDKAGER